MLNNRGYRCFTISVVFFIWIQWKNSSGQTVELKKTLLFFLHQPKQMFIQRVNIANFIYFFDKWNTIRFFTSELTIKEGRSEFPNVQGRNDIKKCWNCLYEEQNFSSFLVFYNFLRLMALRMAAFKTGISWRVIFVVLTNYDMHLGGN